MFKSIFTYELKYWLKQPSFYLYIIVFSLIAFLVVAGTAGLFDPASTNNSEKRLINSPFEINYIFQYFNKFMLFLLPAIVGATIYKDYKNNTHSILYSYPLKKRDYLLGKFLSAILLVSFVALSVAIAMIFAEHLPGLDQAKIGDFNSVGYLQTLFMYTIPNLFFYGAIVFALVTYFRNIYVGFLVIIVLFFIQNITQNIFSGSLIALFDPFGQNAAVYETYYWNLEDKNTKLIPILGVVLYNRLFWFSIATLIFGFVFKSFHFTEQPKGSIFKKKTGKRETKDDFGGITSINLPKTTYNFSAGQQLKNSWLLSNIYLKSIVTSWMFLSIVFLGILAVLFAIGKVTNNQEMTIWPVTNIVLTIPAFFFTTIIMLLTFIYSGMLVHKDQATNMNQLIDASPISNVSLLASKAIAIIKMQALLLLVMLIAGISIQIFNDYYNFEIDLYLFHLFGVQFIGLIIWAFASIFIHTIFKNTYLGIFVLLMGWLAISGIKEMGVNSRALLFNFSEPMQYSDLNGYANQLSPHFLVKGYWLVFASILMLLSYLLWNRGVIHTLKERFTLVKLRFNGVSKIALSVLLTLLFGLGFAIYSEEHHDLNVSSKEQNALFNQFEKDFSKYAKIENQPRVIDIKLNIDVFPKSNLLTINGNYLLMNTSKNAIDTLLVKTGFNETTEFTLNKTSSTIEEDTYVKFYAIALDEQLQPNDSLELNFTLKSKQNTLFENNSNILNNGTLFKNNILPRIGYFLNSNNKHPNDSTSRSNHYYSMDSDFISLKTTISTSGDQIAVAPGYLKHQWSENDRNYFTYETDSKIKNSLSFSSGNYKISKENYKGVDLEIYHHEDHYLNLSKMKDGLKAALDYNTKHFGPYQFTEARIIEFPITEGTYASVMANSIPTSEMRFIANTSQESIDISFYTIAHELTHQWWANQVVPADALGAVMLSESVTEYISLNIYREHYGYKKALDFLKMQRSRYLKGRTSETGIEPPLVHVTGDQQYLAYGKGTMAFNALSHYIGRENLHDALRSFFDTYKNKEAPYPTSIQLVETLREVTPDSLQYIIEDAFETVTFYDSSIQSAELNSTYDGKYEVNVDYTIMKHRNGSDTKSLPLQDFIEFGFYNEADELIFIETINVQREKNSSSFILSQKPSKVVIDPNSLLLEKDINNNEIRI